MTQTLIAQRLLETAATHATRTALVVEGEALTYTELFTAAGALAAQFDAELPAGCPVAILCQKDKVSLTGILGAVLSGRPYVPVNPSFPANRQQSILDVAKPGAIVASQETLARAESLTGDHKIYAAGEDGLAAAPGAIPSAPASITKASPLYYMFTSGTTGTPKGVEVTNGNVAAYLDGIQEIAKITPEDRCSHFFDLSFDLSVHDLFLTWTQGAALYVLSKTETLKIGNFVDNHMITTWFSVPSMAAFCESRGQLADGALPSLRLGLFCGEPLPVTLTRQFAKAAPNAELWNVYGPTEATIAFTAYEVRPESDIDAMATVPLGWPLKDQHIRADAVPDNPDNALELLLGGSQVTPGYTNNAEQNASKFFEESGIRWYRTGDVVVMSEEHGALFGGRIDDQVKINGYRVELIEIETVLRAAAEASQVAALPWPINEAGQAAEVVGFVVSSERSLAEIKKTCRAALPTYMVPRKIVTLEHMPVTASGKVDRHKLRSILEAE